MAIAVRIDVAPHWHEEEAGVAGTVTRTTRRGVYRVRGSIPV
jgi:hypothetical protein